MSEHQEMMDKGHICVIVPTFNNAETIVDVLQRIAKITRNIIVVNDGCTDDTHQRILNSGLEVVYVGYANNRGKGYALQQGFRKAMELGYEYAITIDSDGQHFPEDIPLFLEANKLHKGALLVGARELNPDTMRRGSSFANKFSNFWFNLQTGLELADTQSGYRLYPITRMNPHWIITSRYESELEFLVYSAWKGIEVRNIPIRVYYPPRKERVSHFRPFRDFLRITLLNIVFTTGAVCYYLPLKLIRRIRG